MWWEVWSEADGEGEDYDVSWNPGSALLLARLLMGRLPSPYTVRVYAHACRPDSYRSRPRECGCEPTLEYSFEAVEPR